MPIRTHRGRAAVYRRLWGWPLRSPRHLVGTLLVFAILVTAIGIAVPKLLGTSGNNAPASAAGPTTTRWTAPSRPGVSGTSLPTRLTAPLAAPTSAPPSPEALRKAKDWATAWANHPQGITQQQWLDGLKPHTTEEYLAVLSTVDPAQIPASTVTGEPSAANSFTSSVEALVPTDGPRLSITVIQTNAGWRVSHYDKAG